MDNKPWSGENDPEVIKRLVDNYINKMEQPLKNALKVMQNTYAHHDYLTFSIGDNKTELNLNLINHQLLNNLMPLFIFCFGRKIN